jgi:hypothetical protein
MKDFMVAHGRKIDVAMTVGSIATAVLVGPTMGMSLMFIAGFFSLIRRGVCPPGEQSSTTTEIATTEKVIEGEIVPDVKEVPA